jgi:hypothetical protein
VQIIRGRDCGRVGRSFVGEQRAEGAAERVGGRLAVTGHLVGWCDGRGVVGGAGSDPGTERDAGADKSAEGQAGAGCESRDVVDGKAEPAVGPIGDVVSGLGRRPEIGLDGVLASLRFVRVRPDREPGRAVGPVVLGRPGQVIRPDLRRRPDGERDLLACPVLLPPGAVMMAFQLPELGGWPLGPLAPRPRELEMIV